MAFARISSHVMTFCVLLMRDTAEPLRALISVPGVWYEATGSSPMIGH